MNLFLLQKYLFLSLKVSLEFYFLWMPGQIDIPRNEHVDQLAHSAIQQIFSADLQRTTKFNKKDQL